jgi:dihydrodipicolinate synthase/N-acetylneuraminate lyase
MKEFVFRYKKAEERGAMDDVMFVILPLLHQRFMQLFAHNDSDQSAFIQKQILKIFHAYTQVRIEIFYLQTILDS